jgi:hypothetical protein
MSSIKISELPVAAASINSVVPVSDAGATVTNKVTIGSIIGLVPITKGAGLSSLVGSGSDNVASNDYSSAFGGKLNTASAKYSSTIGGLEAYTNHFGCLAHASGKFSTVGDAQHFIIVARNSTTNTTPTTLFLDGSTELLVMPEKSNWTFTIKVSAYNATDNESGGWVINGAVKRDNSNNIVSIGSPTINSWLESSISTAAVNLNVDNSNQSINIDVTGVASKNIRWVAVIDIAQVIF